MVFEKNLEKLKYIRNVTVRFLNNELKLQINPKSDKILKSPHGLKFLGLKIWGKGRTLNSRNQKRIKKKLNLANVSSYHGLVMKHENFRQIKRFNWIVYEKIVN